MKRSIVAVPVRRIGASANAEARDLLAVEEPLEIRIGARTVAVIMRTPGHDGELACGFLFTERIVRDAAEISKLALDGNVAALAPAQGVEWDFAERRFAVNASCGICGKEVIDGIQNCCAPQRDLPQIDTDTICRLPAELRSRQAIFDHTGGLHAAALFDGSGRLLNLREDVGRHNAVDKLIGAAFLERSLPLDDRILMLSGRVSFELLQKAVMAGIGAVAAVGAPSSLAVQTALRFGVTLIGFVRENRFNVYCGEWRLKRSAEAT